MTKNDHPRHGVRRFASAMLAVTTICTSACDPDAGPIDQDQLTQELIEDNIAEQELLRESLLEDPELQSTEGGVVPTLDPEEDTYGYFTGREMSNAEGHSFNLAQFDNVKMIGPEGEEINPLELDVTADVSTHGLWFDTYWFGGNLFSYSYDIIAGPGLCPNNNTRNAAIAFVDHGLGHAGSCYVRSWYSSNPYDCRIRVRINRPGWYHWGECQMQVYY